MISLESPSLGNRILYKWTVNMPTHKTMPAKQNNKLNLIVLSSQMINAAHNSCWTRLHKANKALSANLLRIQLYCVLNNLHLMPTPWLSSFSLLKLLLIFVERFYSCLRFHCGDEIIHHFWTALALLCIVFCFIK